MMIGTDNKTHTDKQAAGACTPPSRAFRVHYAALFDYDGLEPAQVASGSLAVQEEQVLAELVCCGFGNARKLLSDVGFVQSTETVLSTESCLATARCRRDCPYGVRVSVARLPFCRRRAPSGFVTLALHPHVDGLLLGLRHLHQAAHSSGCGAVSRP